MGIMDRLFGGKKDDRGAPAASRPEQQAARVKEGIPVGMNGETPVLTISDRAKEKVRSVLESQEPAATTIRVSAPAPGRYAMNLEPDGSPAVDDTVLEYEGFQVFVDPHSLTFVEGASLDYVHTPQGEGFQFDNPNAGPKKVQRRQAPEGPQGEIWRQIEEILESEVNPAVASHGGRIDLVDVQGSTVIIEMSGGCQGCGMSKMTLKQGVERILKSHLPEIEEVQDVTDHEAGVNPYYASAGA
jgi:Fe/S biogenesis protein NfuA